MTMHSVSMRASGAGMSSLRGASMDIKGNLTW